MAMATDSRFVKNCVSFVDNTWNALLTDKLGNSDTVAWFGKISAKRKHHNKSEKSSYIYMKMQNLCNFTLFYWDASWLTECRLTQREISTSFLLDVTTLRRWNVVT